MIQDLPYGPCRPQDFHTFLYDTGFGISGYTKYSPLKPKPKEEKKYYGKVGFDVFKEEVYV